MVEFKPGVKITKLDGNGTLKTTVTYHEADKKHNTPSLWNIVEEYDYDGDGKVDEMLIQEYYNNKQLKSSERRKFQYNAQGKTTYESSDRNDDGTIEHDTTWKYDKKGRVIKRTDGGTDGKSTTSIKYCKDGREIIDNDYDGDGTVDSTTVEFNDEKGDVKRRKFYKKNDKGKLVYDGESKYGRDKNGAIIGDHYNKDGYSHSTGPEAYKHPKGFGL